MVDAALSNARGTPSRLMTLPRWFSARPSAAATFGQAPGGDRPLGARWGALRPLGGVRTGRGAAYDIVLAGFAEYGVSTLYVGSSTGLRVSWAQPTGAVNLVGRSPDGRRSAWTGAGAEDIGVAVVRGHGGGVVAAPGVGRRAALALEAGRYEVILPPSGVADMMGSLAFYGLGGQDAEDGRTVFSAPLNLSIFPAPLFLSFFFPPLFFFFSRTRVGDRLTDIHFSLYSDPLEPGLECLPFAATGQSSGQEASIFDNGLPLARTDWIADGVLNQLRYHRAGAEHSGVAGGAVHRQSRPASEPVRGHRPRRRLGRQIEEMVARTERGLLLTCLWYIREVDPATAVVDRAHQRWRLRN